MDARKKIVRDAYDKIANRYLEWSRQSAVRRRYLEKFVALLPENAAVLELGCGAGIPVTKRLVQRAAVTAVDISSVQIGLARTNAPSAELICADMMDLDFAAERFDAVCAFYAITHLPQEEHGVLFSRIARWLKPSGILFANLGVTAADGVTDNWHGAPNYFSHPSAAESLNLLRGAGFTIIEEELAGQDLAGEEGVPFLWVVAVRA